ncbi:AfsR/SARP family transcriptional regulator [Acrocarpospora phusangensis]|uniref:AfsR/SARP family transcriptional regulator n=1 Tax=Acrocarpospora phusangensis TaxID=1070424 RepID=UPI00194FB4FE|nr:AfsR/SARP family transcriptional regulator [Acrocarpospora phusangensis]
MLALLLARANRTASMDWLTRAVWGDRPPTSAYHNLRGYIHRVRRLVGAHRLPRQPDGYALCVDEALDSLQFEKLAARGTAAFDRGEATEAARQLRAALDLWRGSAFSEFADCETIAAASERLEQLRLTTYECWVAAELSLGRHARLIDDLYEAVTDQPYREGLRGHLMLALYRANRRADALAVYREGRLRMATDLGLEPDARLRDLHERILVGQGGTWATRNLTTSY